MPNPIRKLVFLSLPNKWHSAVQGPVALSPSASEIPMALGPRSPSTSIFLARQLNCVGTCLFSPDSTQFKYDLHLPEVHTTAHVLYEKQQSHVCRGMLFRDAIGVVGEGEASQRGYLRKGGLMESELAVQPQRWQCQAPLGSAWGCWGRCHGSVS